MLIAVPKLQLLTIPTRFISKMKRETQLIMKSTEINKLNEANMILRHFVDLSARLLPFLDELQRKQNPSRQEVQNKNKIIDVFESYKFDTRTSELLIGSNILELIKTSFDQIAQTSYFLKPGQKNKALCHFLQEYHRLSDKWCEISTN